MIFYQNVFQITLQMLQISLIQIGSQIQVYFE